jgi:cell division protein FtsA
VAVGLDIGTTKLFAMIGKKNEYGKLEILGVGKSKFKCCQGGK